ncbi:ABC transporter permease [Kibdelosporangium philippinense]|uniref:Autoinducer 2 import system permease protein LsrD n=1 Tax=Kibdelosporangium philippinense TaxID=211113 RepID=A0ABS8ZUK8_9PSEU|nr:ABC transporter permease [Kibdelosporangium philippinense]MCE7010113.1 ABC transporter permease [Kibdelosporangium philippinense]
MTAPAASRVIHRHAWTGAVIVLFAMLLAWNAGQTAGFGAFEIQTMLASTLALAYLAMAQAIVVIGGGIDLSVGAVMVLVNCLSARLMEETSLSGSLLIAVGCLVVAATIGALTGLAIRASGIPDIIVTLATSFMWGGAALFVLRAPGGGTSEGFQALVLGSGSDWWPALLCLLVPLLVMWTPLRRSRAGIAIYAVGSDSDAAYLSGVDPLRTKVITYTVAGLFSGLAGIAVTAFTAGGSPQATIAMTSTLTSVAAIVLGGVALTGGVGGLLGPVIAVWCLYLIPNIMLGLGVDPSYGQVINGLLLVLVVLAGGLLRTRRSA